MACHILMFNDLIEAYVDFRLSLGNDNYYKFYAFAIYNNVHPSQFSTKYSDINTPNVRLITHSNSLTCWE